MKGERCMVGNMGGKREMEAGGWWLVEGGWLEVVGWRWLVGGGWLEVKVEDGE